MDELYDVIVFGAGISGLSAAYYLKKELSYIKILIIVAKNRVGGRTQTVELKCSTKGKMEKWDAGGQWITDSQVHITQLCVELGLEAYKQHDEGIKVLETCGHLVKYSTQIPRISMFSLADLKLMLTRINSCAKLVDTRRPFVKENSYLDELNLKQLAEKYSFTGAAKSIFNAAIRTVYGLEAQQLNAHFASMYISSASTIERLTLSEKDCAQEKKIKGGTQQISERLLDKINSKILYDCPVIEVDQTYTDRVRVTVLHSSTKKFESFYAKKIISSIPVNQYARIDFKPLMPLFKTNIINSMKPGNYIKFVITYKKAFWREKGFSGEVVSDGSILRSSRIEGGPSMGPIAVMYDNTSCSNEPALLGFIGANAAVEWSHLDDETRKQEVLQSISDYFDATHEAKDYIDYYEKNWNKEEFNGGCPTYNVTTLGIMKDYSRALREPLFNVHFCGTETAVCWQGYMDGAVESAKRVKNEILPYFLP